MQDEEKIIRAKTLEDFDRELGRHDSDGHYWTLEPVCSEFSLRQAGSWRRL